MCNSWYEKPGQADTASEHHISTTKHIKTVLPALVQLHSMQHQIKAAMGVVRDVAAEFFKTSLKLHEIETNWIACWVTIEFFYVIMI